MRSCTDLLEFFFHLSYHLKELYNLCQLVHIAVVTPHIRRSGLPIWMIACMWVVAERIVGCTLAWIVIGRPSAHNENGRPSGSLVFHFVLLFKILQYLT